MFKLKFHQNKEGLVEAIEIIDDGNLTQREIAELKPALEKMQIENSALTFSRNHKAQKYTDFADELLNDYAYYAEILSDCWQYPDAPLLNDGKPNIRPYIGILHLLQNALNMILQSHRRLDEYRDVYGELPSDIFVA